MSRSRLVVVLVAGVLVASLSMSAGASARGTDPGPAGGGGRSHDQIGSASWFLMIGGGDGTPDARFCCDPSTAAEYATSGQDQMSGAQGSASVKASVEWTVTDLGDAFPLVVDGTIAGTVRTRKSGLKINCSPVPTCTGGYPAAESGGNVQVRVYLAGDTRFALAFKGSVTSNDGDECSEVKVRLTDDLADVVRITKQAGGDCDKPDRNRTAMSGWLEAGYVTLDVSAEADVSNRYLGQSRTASASSTFSLILFASCTIVGTSGPDVLAGTDGPDVICGFVGDDTVDAKGGDDTVWAGPGDDAVLAGAGGDTVYGEAGGDYVLGGPDADTIDGGSGPDTLCGFSGSDDVVGGPGADRVSGGGDGDSLAGGPDADRIYGDYWLGVITDTLCAGDSDEDPEGDDEVDGGGGRDSTFGGAGDDTFRIRDRLRDTADGGPGDDLAFADRIDRLQRIEEASRR